MWYRCCNNYLTDRVLFGHCNLITLQTYHNVPGLPRISSMRPISDRFWPRFEMLWRFYWQGFPYITENPAGTVRNNGVVITSKRRHFDVITSKWRLFYVMTTLSLRHVFGGNIRPCYWERTSEVGSNGYFFAESIVYLLLWNLSTTGIVPRRVFIIDLLICGVSSRWLPENCCSFNRSPVFRVYVAENGHLSLQSFVVVNMLRPSNEYAP